MYYGKIVMSIFINWHDCTHKTKEVQTKSSDTTKGFNNVR
jgi:hypothetical protein